MDRADHSSLPVTEHALGSLAAVYEQAGVGPDDLDFYSTTGWFQNLAANCLQPSETALVFAAKDVVLPMRVGRARGCGLSNFYSCRFVPPGLATASNPVGAIAALGQALRRRGLVSLRFDALDEGPKDMVAAGLRRAGWLVEPFPQFGNWFLTADGLDFDTYWQQRPGALRNTGRRRHKTLIERGDGEIICYSRPDEATTAIQAYEAVYVRSWQAAEPFPGFMPGLIRNGFADGEVQVWCLSAGGRPVAAQIWVRRHAQATIFKLAYDQDWGKRSVGTVLTMAAMQAALADRSLREIDFGWGDDPYKREWLPERRQRYGIAAYNPRTLAGMVMAIRNLGAKKIRGAVRRVIKNV